MPIILFGYILSSTSNEAVYGLVMKFFWFLTERRVLHLMWCQIQISHKKYVPTHFMTCHVHHPQEAPHTTKENHIACSSHRSTTHKKHCVLSKFQSRYCPITSLSKSEMISVHMDKPSTLSQCMNPLQHAESFTKHHWNALNARTLTIWYGWIGSTIRGYELFTLWWVWYGWISTTFRMYEPFTMCQGCYSAFWTFLNEVQRNQCSCKQEYFCVPLWLA